MISVRLEPYVLAATRLVALLPLPSSPRKHAAWSGSRRSSRTSARAACAWAV